MAKSVPEIAVLPPPTLYRGAMSSVGLAVVAKSAQYLFFPEFELGVTVIFVWLTVPVSSFAGLTKEATGSSFDTMKTSPARTGSTILPRNTIVTVDAGIFRWQLPIVVECFGFVRVVSSSCVGSPGCLWVTGCFIHFEHQRHSRI